MFAQKKIFAGKSITARNPWIVISIDFSKYRIPKSSTYLHEEVFENRSYDALKSSSTQLDFCKYVTMTLVGVRFPGGPRPAKRLPGQPNLYCG